MRRQDTNRMEKLWKNSGACTVNILSGVLQTWNCFRMKLKSEQLFITLPTVYEWYENYFKKQYK